MCKVVGVLGAIALWACGPVAQAQETAGAFHVGLTTPVFSYDSRAIQEGVAGARTELSSTGTTWGIGERVGLELGYALDSMWVVGATLQVAMDSHTQSYSAPDAPVWGEGRYSESSVMVGPKLDVMFAPGSRWRPFIGGAMGLLVRSGESSSGLDESLVGARMQGRLGVRWFPVPGFSIDPALAVARTSASGTRHFGTEHDVPVTSSRVAVALHIGLSGWIR